MGWMGLALSLATTALITNGLKNLVGHPRPDLIARCNPDLANGPRFVLGGVNDNISEGTLVSWTICRQTDMSILKDGFQSFPSGHSSCEFFLLLLIVSAATARNAMAIRGSRQALAFVNALLEAEISMIVLSLLTLTLSIVSFSGLFYFALYLCSKFAVRIPYLSYHPSHNSTSLTQRSSDKEGSLSSSNIPSERALRNEAAAPPTYLIILPLIPICAALYISSTRYSDFKHHGFDIISGASLGIVIAWISFRLYNLPISRGAGWSWRPRSPRRAFGIGIGVLEYVEDSDQRKKSDDPEVGLHGNGETNKDAVADEAHQS